MNLELNGEKLSIQQQGNNFLDIDPTPDDERAELAAINGNGNSSRITNQLNSERAQGTLTADFNNGSQRASVRVKANQTDAFIFLFGLHEFPDNASAISGGLEAGAMYYSIVSGDAILKIVINV